jgi:hypothetical protein
MFYISLALFTENIPVSDGLGWDGQLYAQLAVDFENLIKSGEVPKFKLLKIIPSAICYYTLPLFGREHNFQNVILFFKGFNAISMTVAFFYWLGICKFLKFDTKQTILGTTFCFVNFIFIKYYSFYPVLTDYFAYALAMAGLYHWFKGQTIRLVIFVLLSAWTWTQLTYPLFFLLIFPFSHTNTVVIPLKNVISEKGVHWTVLFVLSFAVSITVAASYASFNDVNVSIGLLISIIEVTILLFTGLKLSTDVIFKNLSDKKSIQFSSIGLVTSVIVYILITIHVNLANFPDTDFKEYVTIKNSLHRAFKYPLISTLSHVLLFSPIIIFIYLNFKRFINSLNFFGVGFALALLFNLIFMFNNESRHMLHIFPFYTILFLFNKNYDNRSIFGIIFLQIVISLFFIKFVSKSGFNEDFFLCFFGFTMPAYYYPKFLFFAFVVYLLFSLFLFVNKDSKVLEKK